MGNCKSSCFKIGSDSAQVDKELSPPEGLRKKYARHQVPSNSVISEPQLIALDKGNPEATTVNFQSEKNSSVPEKTPLFEQANIPSHFSLNNSEKPQSAVKLDETEMLPSAVVNSESPNVVKEKDNTTAVYPEATAVPNTAESTTAIDTNLHENNAIVIQAAARRFLAQRELKKLKHVAKLQAAVRGHLVRRQAIGTLRCSQALVKMQALVRAHLARQCQSLKKCSEQKMDNCKMSRDSNLKSNNTNSTIEKLLSNAFALQLLDSMPKAKSINVTCDPMRHDSAWQWLERWMALTSSEVADQKDLNSQGCDHEENSASTYEEVDVVPDSDSCLLSGSKFSPRISPSAEGEGNSEVHNSVKFESQTSAVVSDQCFNSLVKVDKEHSESERDPGIKEENSTKTAKGKETSNPAAEAVQYPNYADFVSGELDSTAKNDASDFVEVEDKKFDIGSRKVRNPAFAAAQAKFEELSLASKATRSTNYHSRDSTVESKPYKSQVEIKPYIAQVDSVTTSKGISSMENLIIQNPIIQAARSECGTEISISSTLDSPERSEADGGEEIVIEIGATREGNHNLNNGANDSFNFEDLKADAEHPSNAPKVKAMQKIDGNMANSTSPVESANVEEQPAETTALSTSNQDKNLNAQASSEVTQQSKTSKTQNNIHSRKPKSKSISKSLPSKVKNDPGEKSSNEHLPKDVKNVNRRISFGVAKSDGIDHEPRRSTSNSLPSYMQATESARAKAHGSSSVKSSPDIHDKENHVKKRHSLPIGEEKQDLSPRVQKTSPTPKSSKGNNTPSPHSSAERRWQR